LKERKLWELFVTMELPVADLLARIENAITDGFDFYFGHIGFIFGLKVDFGLWVSTQRTVRN
jgi:hypothetical protein